ncbi:MAG TPA: hypothetical protein ENH65_05740 [Candidatus Aminicenantes bacterium]|nr:hypothetical protein [Candidatus Aminicenantes bacterium]
MDETYQHSITIQQSFWSEADLDSRFRAGDQTLWEDVYGNLPAFRKRQFQFNRIRRVCNLVTGHQRRNRKSTVVTPRENADSKTAGQFTKLMYWANDFGNVLETVSGAFDGMLTTGMNLLSVWADYTSDPISGDLRVDNLSYNSYLIDPYFRKHDLSDCNFIWTRKFITKQQAIMLAPEKADFIEQLYVRSYRDGKFQFLPESYHYGMQDLMYYDEYWYRDHREQELLVDARTGETMEWTGNEANRAEFLKAHPQITTIKQTIPTVKLATVLEGNVLYHGLNPMGIDRFPFVPVLGYYDPQLPYFPWRIQGVVRGLRDAQFLYNRRRMIELDILESQINSGWKVKEDALVNPKDAFLTGQGRLLTLKQDAEMTDVEQIQPPQVPPSMIQLSELLGQEISEISGVNEELLGSADDDKAGILSMLRQGAGLTTLQILFDQLDQSQKYLGQIFVEYMQKNFTPGKVERIIDEKPTEEFYHRCFGKYDATVEEGLNTSTQRQTQFVQLLHLKEIGIPVPTAILLENATLSDKEQLIEAIQEEEQQQAQQSQQQQQVQIEMIKAQIQDLQARAEANAGLSIERKTRSISNLSLSEERRMEAIKDLNQSELDKIRSIKELQGIDLEHINKALMIIQALQAQEVEKVEEASPIQKNITSLSQSIGTGV